MKRNSVYQRVIELLPLFTKADARIRLDICSTGGGYSVVLGAPERLVDKGLFGQLLSHAFEFIAIDPVAGRRERTDAFARLTDAPSS